MVHLVHLAHLALKLANLGTQRGQFEVSDKPTLRSMGPSYSLGQLGQLGAQMGQLGAQMGQLGGQMGQFVA